MASTYLIIRPVPLPQRSVTSPSGATLTSMASCMEVILATLVAERALQRYVKVKEATEFKGNFVCKKFHRLFACEGSREPQSHTCFTSGRLGTSRSRHTLATATYQSATATCCNDQTCSLSRYHVARYARHERRLHRTTTRTRAEASPLGAIATGPQCFSSGHEARD